MKKYYVVINVLRVEILPSFKGADDKPKDFLISVLVLVLVLYL